MAGVPPPRILTLLTTARTLLFFLLTALLGSVPPPAASTIDLPDFGDSAGATISPQQERRIGLGLLRHLRHNDQLIDDPEVEAYLQGLGARLAAVSDNATQEFEFFMVDEGSINAFAAPGGFIGTHRGLLLNTETESELAGVLAHEIAHVTQRHMARAFEQASQLSLPTAAAMLGALLLGTQNPQAGQAALAAVVAGSVQAQLNFTRSNEEEADRVGMGILERAGFDPRGMPSFFERLQRVNRLADNPELPEFLRTHPVTVSRIADSRSRADQYPARPYRDGIGFHLVRAALKLREFGDPRLAERYFKHRLDQPGAIPIEAIRYGYALALIAAGDYATAGDTLSALHRADPEQPAYSLAQARLALAQGRVREALGSYEEVLRLYPDYRPAVLGYVQAQLRAGDADRARRLLRDYALTHEADFAYYGLLAEAEGKAGAQIEAHIALAEQAYLGGDSERARARLCYARRARNVDHYQRQRIEARLKELVREIRAERESEASGIGGLTFGVNDLDPARPCP